ncbi:MAG: GAF domain-containing protein [Anaerolineae bacterium]
MPVVSEIVVVSIGLFLFGLLLLVTVSRLRSKEMMVSHLALYAALGVALNLSLLVGLLRVTNLSSEAHALANQFMLVALALTYGALTLSFLKKERRQLTNYWIAALVILLLWGIVAFDFQGWGTIVLNYVAGFNLGVTHIGHLEMLVAELGWLVGVITGLFSLTQDFVKRQPIQYLNKLRYWLISTALLSVAGLVAFFAPAMFNLAGLLLLAMGSILIGYTALSYHTPDLKLLVGRALFYLGVTATLAAVFAVGMTAAVIISRNPTPNELYVLFWTIILAIFLAVIFPAFWRFTNRFFTVLIFGKNYRDQGQVIRHYSQRISSALDVNRLGDIVINLMVETLGIEQGIVFVRERADVAGISLRPVSSIGMNELTTGHFVPDSPFIVQFREGQRIVSQYDIDVLPKFRSLPEGERAWLASLGMELYVPILLQHELIGLLSFGPQPQGTAYYEEDLELMIDLADRVAPAIDNARLFEQLSVINQEVGGLNEKLAGLDQDKADFLSIASHELRTL